MSAGSGGGEDPTGRGQRRRGTLWSPGGQATKLRHPYLPRRTLANRKGRAVYLNRAVHFNRAVYLNGRAAGKLGRGAPWGSISPRVFCGTLIHGMLMNLGFINESMNLTGLNKLLGWVF